MKRLLFTTLLIFSLLPLRSEKTFTILQWNIWQEGTVVKGGYEAIVDEIARLSPDFITLSEVRNYHNVNFTARLCASLEARGERYYSFLTEDSGLLSRFQISDSLTVFPLQNDHGSIYRLLCEGKGERFAVYTAHLDYMNDTYYEIRGYDGSTWKEISRLTDTAEIARRGLLSMRDEAMDSFFAQAAKDEADGRHIILGGDFNEPSLLDWTRETRYLYDHHGVVFQWPATRRLYEAGYTDCYRAVYPNPLTHPGFTYPADNLEMPVQRLTWAPLADERERIDYLFVKGRGLSVTKASVFGPSGCIAYSRRRPNPVSGEQFILPLGTWPTDHKGVWAEISIK